MELRHLRYFVAVAEALNFRRAARRLNLSAPTLSEQIKDLEGTLGVSLFTRSTTSVRLTAAGVVFLAEAKAVLGMAERAAAAARSAGAGFRGTLRLGNVGVLSHGFIPACMEAYRRLCPDVEMDLVDVDVGQQVHDVEEGRIDLGFSPFPPDIIPASLEHFVVVRAPVHVLMAAGHRLASHRVLKRAHIDSEALVAIGPNRRSPHAGYLERLVAAQKVRLGAFKFVSGYDSLLAVVASGAGISFLPKLPYMALPPSVTTRVLRGGVDLTFELRAIWKKAGATPACLQFIEVLRGHPAAGVPGGPRRRAR